MFGAKRNIHHETAELDHQAADNGTIDFDVERDVLAGHRFQCGFQGVEIFVAERLGYGYFRGRLALEIGNQSAECADHVRDRKQPAISGEKFQEVRGNAGDAGALEDRGQRF